MRLGNDFVPEIIQQKMAERTDWGTIMDVDQKTKAESN
jgi:hypothetical protein